MKVISLVNHKGGVGKTTITFNLAVNLTKLGYKVLVIDFDSQGNLSKTVGIEQKYDIENKSYKIGTALEEIMGDLETKLELDKYIHASSKYSDLDIIPCDLSFAETKLRLNAATERCFVLNILINQIKEERDYDFILIDNAPSIDVDFQNSLVASDYALIVTEADDYSVDGIIRLITQLGKIKKFYNPNLQIAGIVINKANMRTKLAKAMTNQISKIFGDVHINVYNSVIPQSVKIGESKMMEKSIGEYDSKNPVTKALESFTEEFVKSVM